MPPQAAAEIEDRSSEIGSNTGLPTREAGLEHNDVARRSQWPASHFTGQEVHLQDIGNSFRQDMGYTFSEALCLGKT